MITQKAVLLFELDEVAPHNTRVITFYLLNLNISPF